MFPKYIRMFHLDSDVLLQLAEPTASKVQYQSAV